MQQGRELEVQIDKFANQGKSLTRIEGFVVFVRSAVPGDRMRIRITSAKKSYAEAEPVELLEASPLRTMPRCIYADTCGGCQWQHLSYSAQLDMKEQTVRDALQYTGRLDLQQVTVREPIPAKRTYYYRNKMAFTFSTERMSTASEAGPSDDFVLGLHPRGHHDTVLDLHECFLQSPLSVRIVNKLREFCAHRNWSAVNPNTSDGYLRQLIIRTADRTSDVMVYLTTTRREPDRLEAVSNFLRKDLPAVTTFVHSIVSPDGADVRHTDVLFGSGLLRERIHDYRFDIGPRTFFQPHTEQAERLYEAVVHLGEFDTSDHLYDLYCGAGTLSLFLSDRVKQITGIEISPEATKHARGNARMNDVDNCRFVTGRVKQQLPHLSETFGHPDVIVCDPPRAGLDEDVVRQITKVRPERLVYVSCDPQTQARDLKRLGDHYTLEIVQPVDLFPQTYHVENVAKLAVKP